MQLLILTSLIVGSLAVPGWGATVAQQLESLDNRSAIVATEISRLQSQPPTSENQETLQLLIDLLMKLQWSMHNLLPPGNEHDEHSTESSRADDQKAYAHWPFFFKNRRSRPPDTPSPTPLLGNGDTRGELLTSRPGADIREIPNGYMFVLPSPESSQPRPRPRPRPLKGIFQRPTTQEPRPTTDNSREHLLGKLIRQRDNLDSLIRTLQSGGGQAN